MAFLRARLLNPTGKREAAPACPNQLAVSFSEAGRGRSAWCTRLVVIDATSTHAQ